MGEKPAWRESDLASLALLSLGVSLFHFRGLLPGQTFLPVDLARNSLPWLSGAPVPLQNWLISDPLLQFYPFLVHSVEVVRQGGWPLWNPHIFLGHPTAADPLAQPFYPVFLALGLVFGVPRGLALGLWLHALLAAIFTYGFLRALGCRPVGSAVGALTYPLSGYMVTWFETPFWISTLTWLPAILWAFEAAVRRRSVRSTLLVAAGVALSVLGGQLSFAMIFLLFLGLYALGRTIEMLRSGDAAYRWPLEIALSGAGLGAMFGAVQIVPFLEFLSASYRAELPPLTDPLPWRQLATLVIPNFYGNPATIGAYWGELNFSEAVLYAGLPALLLACLAPFCGRRFLALYLLGSTSGGFALAPAAESARTARSLRPA